MKKAKESGTSNSHELGYKGKEVREPSPIKSSSALKAEELRIEICKFLAIKALPFNDVQYIDNLIQKALDEAYSKGFDEGTENMWSNIKADGFISKKRVFDVIDEYTWNDKDDWMLRPSDLKSKLGEVFKTCKKNSAIN